MRKELMKTVKHASSYWIHQVIGKIYLKTGEIVASIRVVVCSKKKQKMTYLISLKNFLSFIMSDDILIIVIGSWSLIQQTNVLLLADKSSIVPMHSSSQSISLFVPTSVLTHSVISLQAAF